MHDATTPRVNLHMLRSGPIPPPHHAHGMSAHADEERWALFWLLSLPGVRDDDFTTDSGMVAVADLAGKMASSMMSWAMPDDNSGAEWADFLQQLPGFMEVVHCHLSAGSLGEFGDICAWLITAFNAHLMVRNRNAAMYAAWDSLAQLADLPKTRTSWSVSFEHSPQHCPDLQWPPPPS